MTRRLSVLDTHGGWIFDAPSAEHIDLYRFIDKEKVQSTNEIGHELIWLSAQNLRSQDRIENLPYCPIQRNIFDRARTVVQCKEQNCVKEQRRPFSHEQRLAIRGGRE